MRVYFIVLLFYLLFFGFYKPVSAELFPPANPGTYGCVWVPLLGCRAGNTNCSTGYRVPNPQFCQGLTSSGACAGVRFPCQFIPPNGGSSSTADMGPAIVDCANGKGIETAIGCIPTLNVEGQGLALFFLVWGLGIGGGIALFMIVIASFMISVSAGDPKKIQAGKELLASALSGLVLMVFSGFILKFIGVDLLGVFQ